MSTEREVAAGTGAPERCAECGFDYASVPGEQVPDRLRGFAPSYAEGEWTVAANQGSKALAKPYLIKPAEALKMVSMLDVPGVHDAVEEIVSAARAEAEQQADRLRAELAEIEARLAELSEAE